MTGPRPQLVALLLCDRAFQEAGTGKWCVIGAFDTINAPALPFTLPQLSAFVALSDFTGDATVQLVIRDEEGAVVKAVRGKIPRIPLGVFYYEFPFPGVEFKVAGVHTLELLANEDLITLRSFRVQTTTIDAEDDRREAEGLLEQHRARLGKDALEVWNEKPDAKPVGLIVGAGAASTPWFRQTFASLFGSPPPQMTFVGILDEDSALRLLSGRAPQAADWLAATRAQEGRVLPVVVVMKGGYQLTEQRVDGG